mmetsp:Transcript_22777/g.51544  ORF Transcript_22777/g.51544 Transcript_22777/m.51544 type:complete len:247 (+) Transcript_22777:407-1147(+)
MCACGAVQRVSSWRVSAVHTRRGRSCALRGHRLMALGSALNGSTFFSLVWVCSCERKLQTVGQSRVTVRVFRTLLAGWQLQSTTHEVFLAGNCGIAGLANHSLPRALGGRHYASAARAGQLEWPACCARGQLRRTRVRPLACCPGPRRPAWRVGPVHTPQLTHPLLIPGKTHHNFCNQLRLSRPDGRQRCSFPCLETKVAMAVRVARPRWRRRSGQQLQKQHGQHLQHLRLLRMPRRLTTRRRRRR